MSTIVYVHLCHFPFNFSSLFQMKWKGPSPHSAHPWGTARGLLFPQLAKKFWDFFILFYFIFLHISFLLERHGYDLACRFVVAILMFAASSVINCCSTNLVSRFGGSKKNGEDSFHSQYFVMSCLNDMTTNLNHKMKSSEMERTHTWYILRFHIFIYVVTLFKVF